jgi:Flp pilus assembly protein TadB
MPVELRFLVTAALIVLLFGIKLIFGGAAASGIDKHWKAEQENGFIHTVRIFVQSFNLELTPWLVVFTLTLLSIAIMFLFIDIYPNTFLIPAMTAMTFFLMCLGIMHDIVQWRARKFETQLIDAMDIMIPALNVGNNTVFALRKTANSVNGLMKRELNEIVRRIELGLNIQDAMKRMTDLFDSEGVRMFALAIQTKSRLGGDLAMILRSVSQTMKERVKMRSQMVGQLSGIRLTAFILAAAPYVLYSFFYFVQPQWVTAIHHHALGSQLLYSAMALQVSGMVFLFFILNSEQ